MNLKTPHPAHRAALAELANLPAGSSLTDAVDRVAWFIEDQRRSARSLLQTMERRGYVIIWHSERYEFDHRASRRRIALTVDGKAIAARHLAQNPHLKRK